AISSGFVPASWTPKQGSPSKRRMSANSLLRRCFSRRATAISLTSTCAPSSTASRRYGRFEPFVIGAITTAPVSRSRSVIHPPLSREICGAASRLIDVSNRSPTRDARDAPATSPYQYLPTDLSPDRPLGEDRTRMRRIPVICGVLLTTALLTVHADERPRARDLGIQPGRYTPGPLNAIIDVPGVRV